MLAWAPIALSSLRKARAWGRRRLNRSRWQRRSWSWHSAASISSLAAGRARPVNGTRARSAAWRHCWKLAAQGTARTSQPPRANWLAHWSRWRRGCSSHCRAKLEASRLAPASWAGRPKLRSQSRRVLASRPGGSLSRRAWQLSRRSRFRSGRCRAIERASRPVPAPRSARGPGPIARGRQRWPRRQAIARWIRASAS